MNLINLRDCNMHAVQNKITGLILLSLNWYLNQNENWYEPDKKDGSLTTEKHARSKFMQLGVGGGFLKGNFALFSYQ